MNTWLISQQSTKWPWLPEVKITSCTLHDDFMMQEIWSMHQNSSILQSSISELQEVYFHTITPNTLKIILKGPNVIYMHVRCTQRYMSEAETFINICSVPSGFGVIGYTFKKSTKKTPKWPWHTQGQGYAGAQFMYPTGLNLYPFPGYNHRFSR